MSEAHVRARSDEGATASPLDACPWQVQVVAAVFMFWTASSCARMVAGWLHGVGVIIDFSPILSVLIVYGLLKGWPTWRKVGLFVTALSVVGLAVAAIFLVYLYREGRFANSLYVFGEPAVKAAFWSTACLLAGFAFVNVWVWRVLRNERIRGFFRRGVERQAPRSTRLMWVVTGVLALLVVGAEEYVKYRASPRNSCETVAFGGRWSAAIHSGWRFGRLAYVVFEQSEGVVSGNRVEADGRDTDWAAWLNTPEGGRTRLPNKIQLYEVVGSQVRQSPLKVTGQQFRAFMRSGSTDYSIKALLSFLGLPDVEEPATGSSKGS